MIFKKHWIRPLLLILMALIFSIKAFAQRNTDLWKIGIKLDVTNEWALRDSQNSLPSTLLPTTFRLRSVVPKRKGDFQLQFKPTLNIWNRKGRIHEVEFDYLIMGKKRGGVFESTDRYSLEKFFITRIGYSYTPWVKYVGPFTILVSTGTKISYGYYKVLEMPLNEFNSGVFTFGINSLVAPGIQYHIGRWYADLRVPLQLYEYTYSSNIWNIAPLSWREYEEKRHDFDGIRNSVQFKIGAGIKF